MNEENTLGEILGDCYDHFVSFTQELDEQAGCSMDRWQLFKEDTPVGEKHPNLKTLAAKHPNIDIKSLSIVTPVEPIYIGTVSSFLDTDAEI